MQPSVYLKSISTRVTASAGSLGPLCARCGWCWGPAGSPGCAASGRRNHCGSPHLTHNRCNRHTRSLIGYRYIGLAIKKEKIIIKLVQKQFYNAKKISLSNSAKILKTETPSLCEKFRLDQRSDYNVCRRKTTVKTIALGGGRLVRYPSIAQQVAFTPIPVKKSLRTPLIHITMVHG